jgi:hypothetical protein
MIRSILKKLFSKGKLNARTHKEYNQYQDQNGKWQYSHRKAAENKIGGKIGKNRVVHHKDGNKKNNRWSNLLVMGRREHSKLHAKKKKKSWF